MPSRALMVPGGNKGKRKLKEKQSSENSNVDTMRIDAMGVKLIQWMSNVLLCSVFLLFGQLCEHNMKQ